MTTHIDSAYITGLITSGGLRLHVTRLNKPACTLSIDVRNMSAR